LNRMRVKRRERLYIAVCVRIDDEDLGIDMV
jgi:hypothetical protein